MTSSRIVASVGSSDIGLVENNDVHPVFVCSPISEFHPMFGHFQKLGFHFHRSKLAFTFHRCHIVLWTHATVRAVSLWRHQKVPFGSSHSHECRLSASAVRLQQLESREPESRKHTRCHYRSLGAVAIADTSILSLPGKLWKLRFDSFMV